MPSIIGSPACRLHAGYPSLGGLGALLLLLCSGRALAADAFPGDAHLRDYFLTKRGLGLYFNDNIAKLSISSVRTSSRRVLLLCLLHSSMQRCCCHGGRRALTS